MFIAVVYVPPDANDSIAYSQLYATINRNMQAHPEGAFIVAEDFN